MSAAAAGRLSLMAAARMAAIAAGSSCSRLTSATSWRGVTARRPAPAAVTNSALPCS